jgi:hypothetical protein
MSYFTPITKWRMPEAAMAESCREMARDGIMGNEGVMLWLGQRRDGIAEVTHLVALRGDGVSKRPDLLVIEPYLLNEVTDIATKFGTVLVGQIHSHGQLYGTDLSFADRNLGIRVPYFLSLVAPDYALRPYTEIADCGVHLFEPKTGFRRLSANEVAGRIEVSNTASVEVLFVGEE